MTHGWNGVLLEAWLGELGEFAHGRVTSIERKIFLKELTWQAIRRWWDHDDPDPWRPMDKATYRAVKRRLRRRALREGSAELDGLQG